MSAGRLPPAAALSLEGLGSLAFSCLPRPPAAPSAGPPARVRLHALRFPVQPTTASCSHPQTCFQDIHTKYLGTNGIIENTVYLFFLELLKKEGVEARAAWKVDPPMEGVPELL